MWRLKRQFIILMVPITLLGILLFSLYQGSKNIPTCSDGIQNQQEVGVDCGGECLACRLLQTENPQVIWTRVFRVREESYDAVVFIKNPNVYFGSPRLEYDVVLRDERGVAIGNRANTTFLLPNEEVMIVEPDIRTPLIPKTVDFKVIAVSWIRDDAPKPPYDLGLTKRDYSVVENTGGGKQSVVRTAVFNNSGERFSIVNVSIFLYDQNKNIIGANRTIVENLAADETRLLEFSWPEEIQGFVSSIEGEIRINEFLRN